MRLTSSPPSEAQLEILQLLWQHQPCSIRSLYEIICQRREIGYTTVLRQVQRMEEQGRVKRLPGPGKSYLYEATESATATRGRVLDRVVKNAFGDSVSELMLHALGSGSISENELARIRELLDGLESDSDAAPDQDKP